MLSVLAKSGEWRADSVLERHDSSKTLSASRHLQMQVLHCGHKELLRRKDWLLIVIRKTMHSSAFTRHYPEKVDY